MIRSRPFIFLIICGKVNSNFLGDCVAKPSNHSMYFSYVVIPVMQKHLMSNAKIDICLLLFTSKNKYFRFTVCIELRKIPAVKRNLSVEATHASILLVSSPKRVQLEANINYSASKAALTSSSVHIEVS